MEVTNEFPLLVKTTLINMYKAVSLCKDKGVKHTIYFRFNIDHPIPGDVSARTRGMFERDRVSPKGAVIMLFETDQERGEASRNLHENSFTSEIRTYDEIIKMLESQGYVQYNPK